MLEFKRIDTAAKLVLTLTEMITTTAPNYLFVFTHVTTKEQVSFTKLNSEDESLFKNRYNKFTINPSVVFANKPTGEWHFRVYENTLTGEILEQGKMILDKDTDFSFNKYNSENSFKTYNG